MVSFIELTIGVGFTVMVKLSAGPSQPSNAGITVIVATCGTVSELIAGAAGKKFPEPVVESDCMKDVSLFIQVKVVPVTDPVNVTGNDIFPLQTV